LPNSGIDLTIVYEISGFIGTIGFLNGVNLHPAMANPSRIGGANLWIFPHIRSQTVRPSDCPWFFEALFEFKPWRSLEKGAAINETLIQTYS
jgi:hypothetical protein